MRILPKLRLSVVLLMTTLFASPASAFDADSFVGKFSSTFSSLGIGVTYGSLEPVGDDGVVLKDIQFLLNKVPEPIKIRSLVIEGIKELDGGGFTAQSYATQGISFVGAGDEGELIVTMAGATGSNLYYPDPANTDAPMFLFPTSEQTFQGLDVNINGASIVSGGDIVASTNYDKSSGIVSSEFQLVGLKTDLTLIDEPSFTMQRQALGYDKLSMNMAIAGTWDMNTGRVEIEKYDFGADEAGKLSLKLALSGYTEALAKQLRALSVQVQGGSEQEQQMANMQVLGMLSQLSFESMQLSFKDASLTDRVLELQAQMMGRSKEELVEMVPAMVPMMTSALQNPNFTSAVSAAAGAFLSNPGDITISANPGRLVPVTELMAASAAAPQTLIDLLKIEVKANECGVSC